TTASWRPCRPPWLWRGRRGRRRGRERRRAAATARRGESAAWRGSFRWVRAGRGERPDRNAPAEARQRSGAARPLERPSIRPAIPGNRWRPAPPPAMMSPIPAGGAVRADGVPLTTEPLAEAIRALDRPLYYHAATGRAAPAPDPEHGPAAFVPACRPEDL